MKRALGAAPPPTPPFAPEDVAAAIAAGTRPTCLAPFVTLECDTRGNYNACCANLLYPVGHVSRDRLMDVWTGPRITALREALWDKDLHLGCHGCRWQMENGRGNTPMATYEPYDGRFEDNEYPKTMAFALENTCNLECTMCTGDLSSRIRSRREGRPPLRSPWDDQFFDDLREVLPHLDAARFLGGEPFMIKGHHRIWDMMIEDQIDTACHCTTNGTVWDAKVERALEHLPFSFHISVDAVTPETLRAVRHAIDPDALLANIPKFREYTRERGTDLGFNHCFMQTNYFEFADVLLLADSLDVHVEVISVFDDGFGFHHMEPDDLEKIVLDLERRGDTVLPELGRNRHVWETEVAGLRGLLEKKRADAEGDRLYVHTNALSLQHLRPVRSGGDTDDAAPIEAPQERLTATERAARWSRDGRTITLQVDADGNIVESSLGEGEQFHGMAPALIDGQDIEAVVDALFAQLGTASAWIADEHVEDHGSDYAIGVDEGIHRDSRFTVAIITRPGRDGCQEVAIAVDDSHAVGIGAQPVWLRTKPEDIEAEMKRRIRPVVDVST